MTSDSSSDTIRKALQYLAGVCDGAAKLDGAGFNRFDAQFGHSLAQQSIVRPLTSSQEQAALKMLKKYQGQLSGAGIVLPDAESVKKSTSAKPERKIKILLSPEKMIWIVFGGRPSAEHLAAVKSLPSRKWRPDVENQPWEVPAFLAALVIARFPEAEVSAEVLDLSQNPVQVEEKPSRPEVTLDVRKESIWIMFNGRPSPENREKLDKLFYRKYKPELDPELKPWVTVLSAVKTVSTLFAGATRTETFDKELAHFETLSEMSQQPNGEYSVEGLKGEMFPFQKVGVKFIETSRGRALIADEMGLGKTIQALGYLQLHPELRPAVIVVPASLKINWKREAEKWLSTGDKIAILTGQNAFNLELTGASIFIVNYDILKAGNGNSWLKEIIRSKPAILIADEAHYCKNPKAIRTQAVMEIAAATPNIVLLTGTPVLNRPKEIWPLLNMVDPAEWKSFFGFAKRYCDAKQKAIYVKGGRQKLVWDFGGASNLPELHDRIKRIAIRRTKAEVLKELPSKIRARIVVPFEGAVKDAYDRKMAEIAPKLAKMDAAKQLVEIEALKQAAIEGKMDAAIEWIENFIDGDQKLVVFATHVKTIETLQEHFGKAAVSLYGGVGEKNRQNAIDSFQNDPNVKVFIGQIKAAGVGITLTAASDVLFLEFGWTPGDHTQAEDRCHRIGQTDSVTAWYLAAENTVDEKIIDLLEAKRKVVDTLTDGTPGALDFPNGDILKELVESLAE